MRQWLLSTSLASRIIALSVTVLVVTLGVNYSAIIRSYRHSAEQAMVERPVSAFDLDDSELAMVLAPAVEAVRVGGSEVDRGGRHV